jgi:hypothetical protein
MKHHPCPAAPANAHRPIRPGRGKILLATALFLLAVVHPLFGQPSAGMASPAHQICAEKTGGTVAGAESLPDPSQAGRSACFDGVWTAYQDDVWFYGEEGQRIVPAIDHDWLVVRLSEEGTPDMNASPESWEEGDPRNPPFDRFNARYSEYFSHFLHDPAIAPAMAAYRLRRDMPKEVFNTLMTRLRQHREVLYVHPAWKIAERLYAPLEKFEILWKTSSDMRQRQALLKAAGAVACGDVTASNTWQAAIDPCRQSVWQSANLLAEDILVERARPLLMPLEPPVGVRFEMGMTGATPGTAIPFTLQIRFSDRIKIEPSTIANLNLKPAGIFHNLYDIGFDTPLSSVDLNRSPIRITGHLKIYATGDYSLPGIPVYYTDSGAPGRHIQLIKTIAKPVRIAAMIPATGDGHDLQVADFGPLSAPAPAVVPAPTVPSALLITGGLTLVGLSVGAAWILRKKYRRPGIPTENHTLKRRRARVDAAVAAIQEHRGPAGLADLGVSLKAYLAEFSGLDEDRRGGSHASFLRRIESALPDTCRTTAAELLFLIEHLLLRGEQIAIPGDLAGRVGRLVADLQSFAEPRQDATNKP